MPDKRQIDKRRAKSQATVRSAGGDETFQPIFIVGCPRSGTTLLSVLLDRHSELAVPPETHFVASVIPAAFPDSAKVNGRPRPSPTSVIEELLRRTPLRDLGVEADAVASRLHDRRLTPVSLLSSVLEEYAAVRNKSKVAEKTPGHELHLEQLHAWFPHARFVWIVRDGRDVVLSQRRMHWIQEPLWRLCLHWRRSTVQAMRFAAAHPGTVFRIHYEALVRDPEGELSRLQEFLDLDFEPEQLRPRGRSHVIPAHEKGWKSMADQAISTHRSQAWRQGIGKQDLLLMNCLMGPQLRTLGYADTSVKESGPHAVALRAVIDICLAVLFARRIYPLARAAFRAGARISGAGRGLLVSRRSSILLTLASAGLLA